METEGEAMCLNKQSGCDEQHPMLSFNSPNRPLNNLFYNHNGKQCKPDRDFEFVMYYHMLRMCTS